MSRIDLHVDELLDHARAGTLSASDLRRLTVHCESCVVCRLELAWLADGLHCSAPATEDRALGQRAVEALLGREPEHTAALRGTRAAALRWWRSAALACAGLLLASAAAALYTEVQAWRARDSAPRPSSRAAVATGRAPSHALSARPHGAEPADIVAPKVVALDPGEGPHELVTSAPVASAGSVRPPAITREQRAEALFARANAARAAGDDEHALAGYALLARTLPETRSAIASRISCADLLLRRMHRPEQAVAVYRSYLDARPTGTLAEEARVGIAASLQRLGREDEERTAWQELLDRHPGSLHAGRARARLLALSR